MDYVISSLNEIGYGVDIISPSWLISTEKTFFKRGETISLANNNYIYSPSFNTKYKILNYLTIVLSWLWLFFYLLVKIRKNEKIIVYHSLWLSIPLYYVKKLKNLTIILEIEEIYSEIWTFPKLLTMFEDRIINNSEYYIIASDILKDKLSEKKEKIVLYGDYRVNKRIQNYSCIDKKYINLVYAGGIETVRKGAFKSIDILEYLPNNYYLNIIGFGEDEDIKCLKECIELSPFKNRIKFHGEKKGEDFLTFLNTCDVGLNPQVTGDYMDTAFPSKILTYLGAGLNIISSKVDSIYCSKLKNEIFFYENIKEVENFELVKIEESLIRNLHKQFVHELLELLQK